MEDVLPNTPNPMEDLPLLEFQNAQHNQFNQMKSYSIPMLHGGQRSNWLYSKEANCDGDILQRDASRLSFQELLALAEGGKTFTSTGFDTSRDQFPGFMNFQQKELYSMSQVPTNSEEGSMDTCRATNGGTCAANRCFFDLNSLPREDASADSTHALLCLPEPMILQENKESDQKNRFDKKFMGGDESGTTSDGLGRLQEAENPSQINGPMSTTSASAHLPENYKLDKRSTEEPLLLKSPQQKPRKKHRPKVITEGQPKRSLKSNSKNTVAPLTNRKDKSLWHIVDIEKSNEKSPPTSVSLVQKRKYTKRKIDEDGGTIHKVDLEKTSPITRSLCRRSLNFNMDHHERHDSSSCCPSLNIIGEFKVAKISALEKDELGKNDTRVSQELGNMSSHEQEAHLRYKQQSSGQMDGKTIHDSFFTEEQVQRLKNDKSNEPETCNKNKTGIFYDTLQTYQKSLQAGLPTLSKNNGDSRGQHSLQTCKRKRTENTHTLKGLSKTGYRPDTQSLGDSSANLITSIMNPKTSGTHYDLVDASGKAEQKLQYIYASDCTLMIKRKRSKCTTRRRDLASLMFCKELPAIRCSAESSVGGQEIQTLQSPPACMEAIVSLTQPKIQRKKRTRRSMPIKSTEQCLSGHEGPVIGIKGWPLALTWNSMFPCNTIIQQVRHLDLKAKERQTSIHQQDSHSLVPYKGSRATVPFNNSFEVMKQRLRPKVDLDEETTRVWKLLLENIDNEGIDGSDEEKAKWWEEERRIFDGRASTFIARMHLVQGDRRFSPWKGSVVDSVVGVFLTQNVSDHLSSSAFMSMAARFPISQSADVPELHENHSKINLSEALVLDPDGTYGLTKDISDHSIYCDVAEAHHQSKNKEMGELSVKSNGHTLNGLFLEEAADNLECEWLPSLEAVPRKSTNFIEDNRYTNSSQNSMASPTGQATEKNGPLFGNHEGTHPAKQDKSRSTVSLENLMQRTENILQGSHLKESCNEISNENGGFLTVRAEFNEHSDGHFINQTSVATTISLSSQSFLCDYSTSDTQTRENFQPEERVKDHKRLTDKEFSTAEASGLSSALTRFGSRKSVMPKHTGSETPDFTDGMRSGKYINLENKEVRSMGSTDPNKETMPDKRHADGRRPSAVSRPKDKQKTVKEREIWEALRKKAIAESKRSARRFNTNDTVDWDAVRCADVNEIAQAIKARGMNNNLAERIKEFLNRLVREHGSIDLEWLRDIPPDKAKEYLLSFRGLGLKSVECVRLLTLHHLAFPVDTNVGRIAVRLGWVPLQPLPESLQLHLLELYPVLESIQKYLWPRLCKLDQKTLYELHYQMITFGKVFCTKSKPNCNACPMRAECRHFASAFASARLALPRPERIREVSLTESKKNEHTGNLHFSQLPFIQYDQSNCHLGACEPIIEEPPSPEPIAEMPTTPEPNYHAEVCQYDNEKFLDDGAYEIPIIQLNIEEFTQNLQKIVQQNTRLKEGEMSRALALVALASDTASIPIPKLKNVRRLRTEHRVYELPDSHPLLQKMDKREPDDPSPYLLAIWAPGETANSIEQPQKKCSSRDSEKLCTDETCSSCNSIREASTQTVRGTILIPCRTAMRGSFPLNGTYFQVNEVFSDHDSSLSPIEVPRDWIWNLPRRTVYFGTSVTTIFRGLSTEEIQYCFWRGFVCVRGFDRKERAPRPLIARLHFPASKLTKSRKKSEDDQKMDVT